MARTASTYEAYRFDDAYGRRQMEAIAWNTSQASVRPLRFTAQNYAARKKERILTAYHTTLKMTSIIGVLCTLLFVFYVASLLADRAGASRL